jgi:hypothetical protein
MKIFVYDYDVLGLFIVVFSLKGSVAKGAQKFHNSSMFFHIKTFNIFSKFPVSLFASNTQ